MLRVALGSTSVMEGGACLLGHDGARTLIVAAGLLEIVGGVLLLLGCLTPLACVLVALSGAAVRLTGVPDVFPVYGGLLLILVSTTAAVVLLGPGAFSLDARLFGRRKVIIPQASHTPKF